MFNQTFKPANLLTQVQSLSVNEPRIRSPSQFTLFFLKFQSQRFTSIKVSKRPDSQSTAPISVTVPYIHRYLGTLYAVPAM